MYYVCMYVRMANALTTFPEFDVSETSTLAARWQKWLSRFETLLSQ